MVPDRQKVRTDGMDGRPQNYIPPTSSGDNNHVLTGKNTCINQAIHMLLMHGFCTLHIHILGHHKIDVININVHRNELNLVMLG